MESGGGRSVKFLGIVVVLITITSFLGCILLKEDNVRFYFPFSRFWELGVGVCIAYSEVFLKFKITNHSQFCSDLLSLSGVVLVLGAFLVPIEWYSTPPGLFSLFPVLGSALLILANSNGCVNRTFLSWKWVIFIGLISYSLYLWHWPFLAFIRLCLYRPPEWLLVLSLVFSTFIAVVMYRFVENPIRRAKTYKGTSALVLGIVLLCLFVSGKFIRAEDGFPQRAIAQMLNFKEDWLYSQGLVSLNDGNMKVLDEGVSPEILFIGDSHIEQYYPRVRDLARKKRTNIGFLTEGGCMTSIGKNINGRACLNSVNELELVKESSNLRTLVIAQKWGDYGKDGSNILKDGWSSYLSLIDSFLREDDSRKVFVIMDNPWDESKNKDFDFRKYVSRIFNSKENFEQNGIYVALPRNKLWKSGNEYIESKKVAGISFIETASKICPNGICNLLNYKDDDHLRSTYVRDYATWIDQVFE